MADPSRLNSDSARATGTGNEPIEPLDVELLKRHILEAVRRRATGHVLPETSAGAVAPGPLCTECASQSELSTVAGSFASLELYADLDTEVPPMLRLPRLLRRPVRLATRFILALLRFLIRQQIDCNFAFLDALRKVHEAGPQKLADMERELASLREAVRRLEVALQDSQQRRGSELSDARSADAARPAA